MRNSTKIMSMAALAAALVAAIPASAQQQTSVQPFVPYNGTNGAGPLNPAAGPAANQNPYAPGAVTYLGLGYNGAYRGNGNYNPACDPHSQYYNPNACR